MRFNKKELAHFSSTAIDFEGRLNYRTAGSNFAQPVFKERWFKLKSNCLFYFRFNDFGTVDSKEPAGVYVLENVSVQREELSEMPFALSLIFKDDPDYKHMFSARSEDLITSWINAISQCSYEHLRNKLDSFQTIIKTLSGVENIQLSPYVNKQWDSQPVKMPLAAVQAGTRSPRSRPKTESFKSHVPLFDQTKIQANPASTSVFSPPASPVRPSRSTDSNRNSPSGSPIRVPIRKPPPPPTKDSPVGDLIEF